MMTYSCLFCNFCPGPLAYARDHQPCIIFMDEIDAIGGKRFSEGTSADREIQRTLMELLNQMDGFDRLGQVKMIMATNRPDVLDPALLRPGRLDRKIGEGWLQSVGGQIKHISMYRKSKALRLHILMFKQAMISNLDFFHKCIKGYNIFGR